MKKIKPVVSVKLYTEEKCFGPGVCRLLEIVEEEHSLRKAALSMNMAYSKAWKIVKNAEEELGFELLSTKIGGKEGGGAVLTDKAKKIVSDYRNYESEIKKYSSEKFKDYFNWL